MAEYPHPTQHLDNGLVLGPGCFIDGSRKTIVYDDKFYVLDDDADHYRHDLEIEIKTLREAAESIYTYQNPPKGLTWGKKLAFYMDRESIRQAYRFKRWLEARAQRLEDELNSRN